MRAAVPSLSHKEDRTNKKCRPPIRTIEVEQLSRLVAAHTNLRVDVGMRGVR